MNNITQKKEFNRRDILKLGALAFAAPMIIVPKHADAGLFSSSVRKTTILNTHTGERFSGEFWENGKYLDDAFREIKKLFRDHRTGDQHPIDPKLLDTMAILQKRARSKNEFEMYSGYRSHKTNEKLRRMSFGVAKKSFHLQGQAVDLSLPGTNIRKLQKEAIKLKSGGVGFYPESNFVHLDTGRVRHW